MEKSPAFRTLLESLLETQQQQAAPFTMALLTMALLLIMALLTLALFAMAVGRTCYGIACQGIVRRMASNLTSALAYTLSSDSELTL